MAVVRIDLFGGLAARSGNRVVRHFETRKAAELLAFLAISPGRSYSRDYLMELLWPDEDPDATRVRLRQVLSALRRSLENEEVLVADRSSVHLDPSLLSTDVLDFERERRSAGRAETPEESETHLRAAAEIYAGELLPDIGEAWASSERFRLAEGYQETLGELADRAAERGEFQDAIEFARRALRPDPLKEGAHTRLMRLFAAAGRPAEALRQYHELERVLREELGASPSAETRQLLEDIRSGRISGAAARQREQAPVPGPVRTSLLPPRLPLVLAHFFGREEEIEFLTQALLPDRSSAVRRLVTITGLGGTGKTRLALEAAYRLADVYEQRVWFVSLGDVDDADLLLDSVHDSLGLERTKSMDARQEVADALGTAPALLVLDNFEQIVGTGTKVVAGLLSSVPSLRCLVTSRQRLDLPGERELPLSPLPVPVDAVGPDRLLEFPGVQLFVDRVQAVRPRFALTDDNAEAVSDVCRYLDGLPLALDLVAAWSATLTPAQMRERLAGGHGKSLDFLVSRRKEAESRHRSLRTALEGSLEQLPPELQRFFVRLSVFRGGFSLEAAEKVAGAGIDDVLDAIAELQSRSLVREDEVQGNGGNSIRFSTLSTLRAFAAERLGEDAPATQETHARFYFDLVQDARDAIIANDAAWLDRLETEHDNLRGALAWGRRNDMESTLVTAYTLSRFWHVRGHSREWRAWLSSVIPEISTPVSDWVLAATLQSLASLCFAQSDFPASRRFYEQAVEVWRRVGEALELVRAVKNLSHVVRVLRDYHGSRRLLEEAIAIARESESPAMKELMPVLLLDLGSVLFGLNQLEEAREIHEECLDRFRAQGDQFNICCALNGLAMVLWALHDNPAARSYLIECVSLARDGGYLWLEGAALHGLGELDRYDGELVGARDYLRQCVQVFRRLDNVMALLCAVEAYAYVALAEGDAATAARLLGASVERRKETGTILPQLEQSELEEAIERTRRLLGEHAFSAATASGSLLSVDEAVQLALTV
jgi:predicted ATPase/DNA-binding SARP family transcriptional activator